MIRLTVALNAFALVLVAGCTSLSGGAPPAEELVLARSQARWNALIKREWSVAYPFMTPAYRAMVSPDRFSSQFTTPVRWEDAKPKSAVCDEKRCTVTVEVFFRLLLPLHRNAVSSTFIEEAWVLEEGQWYYVERP
jgi:hypothetical protein